MRSRGGLLQTIAGRAQPAKVMPHVRLLPPRPQPGTEPDGGQYAMREGWIYLVEDLDVSRRLAQHRLDRLGWRVFSFPDAAGCLAALKTHPPQAMLLDIGLPDADGMILASRLRHNHRTRDMRIVAYTSLDGEERAALARGPFDAVIGKPGSFEDFARALPGPGVDARLPG